MIFLEKICILLDDKISLPFTNMFHRIKQKAVKSTDVLGDNMDAITNKVNGKLLDTV